MKNITLAALFLCAIPVSALWEGASPLKVGVADTGVAFLLPHQDNSLTDLDVRDSQGRPISTPAAVAQLESLFRENLVDLLVFAAPHAVAQTKSYIESISHLLNSLILKRLLLFIYEFQAAILPAKKRFVHNVDNLWITHFTGLSISRSTSLSFCRPTSASPLPLRC